MKDTNLELMPSTYDDFLNGVVILGCLLAAALGGCGAGYAYARQRYEGTAGRRIMMENWAAGRYGNELAEWDDEGEVWDE